MKLDSQEYRRYSSWEVEGLRPYKGYLLSLWSWSININKPSEIGRTQTNLVNYELCALSFQAHTTVNNRLVPCELSVGQSHPAQLDLYVCLLFPEPLYASRGPYVTLSSCQSWEQSLSLHHSQAWEGWWIVIPLSWPSIEAPQSSEWCWRYWIQEQPGEHCFFIIRTSRTVGVAGWKGTNVQVQLRGLWSLYSWFWWESENCYSEFSFPPTLVLAPVGTSLTRAGNKSLQTVP